MKSKTPSASIEHDGNESRRLGFSDLSQGMKGWSSTAQLLSDDCTFSPQTNIVIPYPDP